MTAPTIWPTGAQLQSPPNGMAPMIGTGPQAAQVRLTSGTFVANGTSTVTTTQAAVTATSMILISLNTVGGTVGAIPVVTTITAGTGFTTVGTASDTSTYNYLVIG